MMQETKDDGRSRGADTVQVESTAQHAPAGDDLEVLFGDFGSAAPAADATGVAAGAPDAVQPTQDFQALYTQADIDRPERRRQYLASLADPTDSRFTTINAATADLANFFATGFNASAEPSERELPASIQEALAALGWSKYELTFGDLLHDDPTRRATAWTNLRQIIYEDLRVARERALYTDIDAQSRTVRQDVANILQARERLPQQAVLLLQTGLRLIATGHPEEGIQILTLSNLNCDIADFPSWVADELLAHFANADLRQNHQARAALNTLYLSGSVMATGMWSHGGEGFPNATTPAERLFELAAEAYRTEEKLKEEAKERAKEQKYRDALISGYEQEFTTAYQAAHAEAMNAFTQAYYNPATYFPSNTAVALERLSNEMSLDRSAAHGWMSQSQNGPEMMLAIAGGVLADDAELDRAINLHAGQSQRKNQYYPVWADHGMRRFGSQEGELPPPLEHSRRLLSVQVEAYGAVAGIIAACIQTLSKPNPYTHDGRYESGRTERATNILGEALKVLARASSDQPNDAQQFIATVWEMAKRVPPTTSDLLTPHIEAETTESPTAEQDLVAVARTMGQAQLARVIKQEIADLRAELESKQATPELIRQQLQARVSVIKEQLQTNTTVADAAVTAERHQQGQERARLTAQISQESARAQASLRQLEAELARFDNLISRRIELRDRVQAIDSTNLNYQQLYHAWIIEDSSANPPIRLRRIEPDAISDELQQEIYAALQVAVTAMLAQKNTTYSKDKKEGILGRRTVVTVYHVDIAASIEWRDAQLRELAPQLRTPDFVRRQSGQSDTIADVREDYDRLSAELKSTDGSKPSAAQLTILKRIGPELDTARAKLAARNDQLAQEVTPQETYYNARLKQEALRILFALAV